MAENKLIYTAGYGSLRKVPRSLVRVAISRGVPPYLKDTHILEEKRLCPTWAMLKMPRPRYDEAFQRLLAKLDPLDIYYDLPSSCVLLCWEAPNVWCHRRAVAEWLEKGVGRGLTITEYGLARSEVAPYRQLPEAKSKVKKGERQRSLF